MSSAEAWLTIATLVLVAILLCVIVAIGVTLIAMVGRQRSDLVYNRKIVAALIELSVQIEHGERRTRHAVKNLCVALTNLFVLMDLPVKPDFSGIERSLEELPDFPPRDPGSLIQDLVENGER